MYISRVRNTWVPALAQVWYQEVHGYQYPSLMTEKVRTRTEYQCLWLQGVFQAFAQNVWSLQDWDKRRAQLWVFRIMQSRRLENNAGRSEDLSLFPQSHMEHVMSLYMFINQYIFFNVHFPGVVIRLVYHSTESWPVGSAALNNKPSVVLTGIQESENLLWNVFY